MQTFVDDEKVRLAVLIDVTHAAKQEACACVLSGEKKFGEGDKRERIHRMASEQSSCSVSQPCHQQAAQTSSPMTEISAPFFVNRRAAIVQALKHDKKKKWTGEGKIQRSSISLDSFQS